MSTNRIAALFPAHAEPAIDPLLEVLAVKQRFWPGCRVRVCSGVMEGVEGRILAYCSASRVIIAVDLNCQGVTVEIDQAMVRLLDG